jgi:hypothetical protein
MKIIQAFNKLEKYIQEENYKGFDPYDALSSPVFKLPLLRNNKLLRFTTQQAVKRSRINLRSLLFIPKGYNPVTLGLVLQGYCYLIQNSEFRIQNSKLFEKIEFLVDELERLQSNGFAGACWGYDFDWEARYAKIPAYQPTVVATGIITNALYYCYQNTGNEKAKELVISAANFVLKDLNRTKSTGNSFCFSYSPFDSQVVYNASMKASRLLAQAYSLTKNTALLEISKHSVEFVVKMQNKDGSWFYSLKENGRWIDNYHTGYVMDCLDEFITLTGDTTFTENLNHGIDFYVNNLFENNKVPKFYNNKKYPIDCTAAGQAILTLTRFGYYELAKNVTEYMIDTMQDKKGYFYFRNYGKRTDKTSFMRWSNAWMYVGLSYLLSKRKELN